MRMENAQRVIDFVEISNLPAHDIHTHPRDGPRCESDGYGPLFIMLGETIVSDTVQFAVWCGIKE